MLVQDWSSFLCSNGQIQAWTSLKEGGVSQEPFDSLNLSFEVNDDQESVLENRRRLRASLPPSLWIESKQVHKTNICWIEEFPENNFKHPYDPEAIWVGEADILITRVKGLTLTVKHADCQSALIYDPITQTIAAIHAGWKGLIGGAYEACIESMILRSSSPQDIKIVIGPSLQSCCAEFKNWQSELGAMAQKFEKKPLHFSLTEIALEKLKALGLLEKNIYIDNKCTCCSHSWAHTNKADYYSFRQNKGSFSGRHISAITYSPEIILPSTKEELFTRINPLCSFKAY